MPKTDRSANRKTGSQPRRRVVDEPYFSACNTCRYRKVKCDGETPCGTCERDDYECTWSDEPDKRRRVSRQFAETIKSVNQSLKSQIELLKSELALAQHQRDIALRQLSLISGNNPIFSPSIPSGSGSSSLLEVATVPEEDPEIDKLCAATPKLTLEDSASLPVLYGAMSPFSLARSSVPAPPAATSQASHELCLISLHNAGRASPNPASTPCLNFNHHLPGDVPITRIHHDTLLSRFFKFFTSWCFRIVPSLFLRDMHRELSTLNIANKPKTPHYSGLLHNAIMAVASAFSDDQEFKAFYREKFAKRAKDFIEEECRRPTLSVVQALAILASYYSGSGEQGLGFLYFGMSIRMSQALGLGSDWIESRDMTPEDHRDRAWMFWMTFVQDKCWSIYVGRDVGVRPPYASIPVPQDLSLDLEDWVWNERDQIPRKSYVSLAFKESVHLFLLATRIMDTVYGHQRYDAKNVAIHQTVADIHLELDGWFNNLPEELCIPSTSYNTTIAPPHILCLHLAYYWVAILLRRPFYRTASRLTSNTHTSPLQSLTQYAESSRERCDAAAEQIIRLLKVWQRLYSLRFVPITVIQFAFTAGTMYLLQATDLCKIRKAGRGKLNQKQQLKLDTMWEKVGQCSTFLEEMGESWEGARKNAEILQALLEEQQIGPSMRPPPDPSGGSEAASKPTETEEDWETFLARNGLIFPPPEPRQPSPSLTYSNWPPPPVPSFEVLLNAPMYMQGGNPIPPQPYASVIADMGYILGDQCFGPGNSFPR